MLRGTETSMRIIAIAMLVLLISCGSHSQRRPLGSERESAAAADGAIRAFIWLPDLSAAMGGKTSQPYQVWAQEQGPAKVEQLLLTADQTDGLQLLWSAPGRLEVCYAEAQIVGFANRVAFPADGPSLPLKIEVTLRRVDRLQDCMAR
jgi:hypothetical protein